MTIEEIRPIAKEACYLEVSNNKDIRQVDIKLLHIPVDANEKIVTALNKVRPVFNKRVSVLLTEHTNMVETLKQYLHLPIGKEMITLIRNTMETCIEKTQNDASINFIEILVNLLVPELS